MPAIVVIALVAAGVAGIWGYLNGAASWYRVARTVLITGAVTHGLLLLGGVALLADFVLFFGR